MKKLIQESTTRRAKAFCIWMVSEKPDSFAILIAQLLQFQVIFLLSCLLVGFAGIHSHHANGIESGWNGGITASLRPRPVHFLFCFSLRRFKHPTATNRII